jgi:putative transposase
MSSRLNPKMLSHNNLRQLQHDLIRDRTLSNWLVYYHQFRPHQGLGNVVLTMPAQPPASEDVLGPDVVVCHEWLGGLLKHYERKVA